MENLIWIEREKGVNEMIQEKAKEILRGMGMESLTCIEISEKRQ